MQVLQDKNVVKLVHGDDVLMECSFSGTDAVRGAKIRAGRIKDAIEEAASGRCKMVAQALGVDSLDDPEQINKALAAVRAASAAQLFGAEEIDGIYCVEVGGRTVPIGSLANELEKAWNELEDYAAAEEEPEEGSA